MNADREESRGEAIHREFLDTAGRVSLALADAIATVGPRRFPDRGGVPLGYFLARTIVGQQLSTSAARSIWSRVERHAADTHTAIPDVFTHDHHEALRACGISRNKIRALLQIREASAEGRLSGPRLRGLDHDTISRELLSLWGVGQWTCDMTAMFYCRCPDVWPQQDVTVQKTFSRLIGRRRKPAKWAGPFAPHRSWLALYMWALADARPDQPV